MNNILNKLLDKNYYIIWGFISCTTPDIFCGTDHVCAEVAGINMVGYCTGPARYFLCIYVIYIGVYCFAFVGGLEHRNGYIKKSAWKSKQLFHL